MSFWDAQQRSHRKSRLCVILFFLITVTAAFILELAMRKSFRTAYKEQVPFVFIAFTGVTMLCATIYFLRLRWVGGAAIARTMGAKEISTETTELKEKQLLNILDEIKIAANLPSCPKLFLLPSQEINAFAAGILVNSAAITVTQGALDRLTREELQGVIAHEVGHIVNKDMQLNSQLAALLYGLTFITSIGYYTLRFCGLSRASKRKASSKDAILYVAALLTIGVGGIAWLLSKVIQSCLSQEREYLADASSVQFTRSGHGLINALRKIEHDAVKDMPMAGAPFSHLYFQKNRGFLDTFLASHPPVYKRIMAIEEMTCQKPS